jgi:hypothetical protein
LDGLLYNEKQTIALKNILILFAVFFFSSVHAQYEWTPAKVILKNGQSFRGLVKFPKHSGGLISIGSTEFKYKKNKIGTTKKYGSESVDEVIFGDAYFATVHYKYVPIKKNKSVLMELAVRGKANLYKRTVLNSYSTPHVNQNSPLKNYYDPSTTTYYDDTQFFTIRDKEQKATLIVNPNSFSNFILNAKKYFSDCSEIVLYLDNDLYALENIIELVEDYNLLCE